MFTPRAVPNWRERVPRVCTVAALVLPCAWPCMVPDDRCVPAAVSQPLRHRGDRYFASLPAWCFKNRQYSSMVWCLSRALHRDAALQAAVGGLCHTKVILVLNKTFPLKSKRSSANFGEKGAGHAWVSCFLPLCCKLAVQPSLRSLCRSVHSLAGKIALGYVIYFLSARQKWAVTSS